MIVKTRAEHDRSTGSSPQRSAYLLREGGPGTGSFPPDVELTGVCSFFGVGRCSNLGSR
jgi:hypothetical protein